MTPPRRARLLATLFAAAACDRGSYAVEVRLPAGVAPAQLAWVDLYVLPDCAGVDVGGDPRAAGGTVLHFERLDPAAMAAAPLGAVRSGTVALYARASTSDGCAVLAAACQTYTVAGGSRGTLVLALAPLARALCAPGDGCDAGACVFPNDAGDAGDAGDGSDACVPDCSRRHCGSDGCGGSCGDCPAREACDEITGICGACGRVGLLCCTAASGAGNGCDGGADAELACGSSQRCTECGYRLEPCCAGERCLLRTLVCDPAPHECRPCGGQGQACCAGATCAPHACDGGASIALSCDPDAGTCVGHCAP